VNAGYQCNQYHHSVYTNYYANICVPQGGSAPRSIGGVEEWWQITKNSQLVPDCTMCASWGPKEGQDDINQTIPTAPMRTSGGAPLTKANQTKASNDVIPCCFYADQSSDDTEGIHTLV